jgi:uncharacterized membrane protein YeiH
MPGPDPQRPTASNLLVASAGLLAVYLAAYLSLPIHRISLARVLLPDQILSEMVGGSLSRVSLLDRIPLLAATSLMLLAASLLGGVVLHWVGKRVPLQPLERWLLSVAAGLSLLSTFALLLGLAGIGTSPLPYMLLLAIAAGCHWRQRQEEGPSPAQLDLPAASEQLSRRWQLLLVPLAVVIVAGAMLPPLDFDVREYHMQVPREWHQQGQVTFLEHNVYGNMPLGVEILAMPVMAAWPGSQDWWWGSLVGKTLIGCFAVLTALLLVSLGNRLAGPAAGCAAGVIYLSIPWVGLVSMNGLIDAALGFYLLSAAAALFAWHDREDWRWPLLVGLLAGAAAGCKYPALLWGVVPAGLAVLLISRRRFAAFSFFSLAAIVAGGGWYLKNLLLAGNPFYPLWDNWFSGTRSIEQIGQWSAAHQVPPFSFSLLVSSILDFVGRDNYQAMLLIPAMLPAIPLLRTHRQLRWVAIYSLFFLASWWLLTHRISRFWVPVLPFLGLLAGVGLAHLLRRRPAWLGGLLTVATVSGLLVITMRLPFESSTHDNRLLVSLDQLRRGPAQLDEPDDLPLLGMHRWLNQQLGSDATLLLVGDAEPFDLEMNVLYNTCFDNCLLEVMMKGRTAEQRRRQLEDAGVTHVFVQWSAIRRYRSPGNYGFTDFVTTQRLHDELVTRDGLLQPVPLTVPPEFAELFKFAPRSVRK